MGDGMISLPAAFAILATVVGALFAVYSQIVVTRERNTVREMREAIADLTRRLYDEEKATIRQDGKINLIEKAHDGLQTGIDKLERLMNDVLRELRSKGHGSGGYAQTRLTSADPRRDPDRDR